MRFVQFTGLVTAIVLVVIGNFADGASAADLKGLTNKPVVVTLIDGRMPRGVLSEKTGDNSLVLRSETPDILIESRFSWGLVTMVNELPTSGTPLLPHPPEPVPITPNPPTPAIDNAIPPAPAPIEPEQSLLAPQTLLPVVANIPAVLPVSLPPEQVIPDLRRAVTSLNISASVANWNPDAQLDGLLLRVQPLDANRNVVPIEGYLDVQLATETKLWSGGQPIRRDDRFQISERWSVPIHTFNFSPSGAMIRLPFRSFRPDRNLDIAPDALVYARLRLPTAGTFDASDDFVLLRTPSRFRDDLQQSQGQRLLPIEGAPRW